MQVEIQHQPSYALAICRLEAGETIQAESGAMVSMSASIDIETQMKGGLFGAVKRKLLGGESLFTNTFTATRTAGVVNLAPGLPGDVIHIPMQGETLFIQSGSFLACNPSIDVDIKWGGAKTFFGSEGLFLLKAAGTGDMIVSSYGAIHKVEITAGEDYICDTGHVVAFTDGLSFDVKRVGGLKSTFLSGEGLVCRFSGQGTLYMQTRSTQAFLAWLLPRIPTQSGGRGSSGIVKNMMGG